MQNPKFVGCKLQSGIRLSSGEGGVAAGCPMQNPALAGDPALAGILLHWGMFVLGAAGCAFAAVNDRSATKSSAKMTNVFAK